MAEAPTPAPVVRDPSKKAIDLVGLLRISGVSCARTKEEVASLLSSTSWLTRGGASRVSSAGSMVSKGEFNSIRVVWGEWKATWRPDLWDLLGFSPASLANFTTGFDSGSDNTFAFASATLAFSRWMAGGDAVSCLRNTSGCIQKTLSANGWAILSIR